VNGINKEGKQAPNGKKEASIPSIKVDASVVSASAIEKTLGSAAREDRSASAAKAASASPPITPPSPSPNLSSKFNPELPPTLLHPSVNQLPANRKRKTPQDFTPNGPNDLIAPASPNKNSVKFEDGILPGEGKDGEKTISTKPETKKPGNAVTRTVWTFIMIFGFISKWFLVVVYCDCQQLPVVSRGHSCLLSLAGIAARAISAVEQTTRQLPDPR
jgi:phosphatidate cytidylyltransferase